MELFIRMDDMTFKAEMEKPINEFHRLLLRLKTRFLKDGGDMNDIAPALQKELDEMDEEMHDQ